MWTNLQIVPKANDENSTRPNILIQGPYRHLGALSILALPSSIFNVSFIGELAKKESDKIASNPGVKLIEPLNMNRYTIDGEKVAMLTYTSSIDFHDVADQGETTIHNGKVYTFYILFIHHQTLTLLSRKSGNIFSNLQGGFLLYPLLGKH
jgi:hypothetical protein